MALIYFDCPSAFTEAECESIILVAGSAQMEPGPVWRGAGYGVDPALRNVSTSYQPRDDATQWIYDRLDALFAKAAAELGMAVGPVSEDIQIMRYDTGCHFKTWHTDAGADKHSQRVISVSVELSDPDDYEGGVLEIVPDAIGRARSLARGGARFFPSRALHRVTPVTRGVRHALVIWTGTRATPN